MTHAHSPVSLARGALARRPRSTGLVRLALTVAALTGGFVAGGLAVVARAALDLRDLVALVGVLRGGGRLCVPCSGHER
jgi:hypothetical protein